MFSSFPYAGNKGGTGTRPSSYESLMFPIERAHIYKDMVEMKEHFDMSTFEAT